MCVCSARLSQVKYINISFIKWKIKLGLLVTFGLNLRDHFTFLLSSRKAKSDNSTAADTTVSFLIFLPQHLLDYSSVFLLWLYSL